MLGFPIPAGQGAFEAARSRSLSAKQDDIATYKRLLTGAAAQIAIRSADRAHRGRDFAAARDNGMVWSTHWAALQLDPPPPELFARTDSTAFPLAGGHYVVNVAGTFGEGGGTIELADADSNIFATFTDDGAATVDLRYGAFNFAVSNVTDLVAVIQNAPY
jgi:hypothetical protein